MIPSTVQQACNVAGHGADVHFDLRSGPRWSPRRSAPRRSIMHAPTRRSVLLGALAAPLAAQAQPNVQGSSQGWLSGPIKIVVPYPPGGSTDVIARLVQGELQQRLGTPVIIENRAGASGSIGTAAVAKS